MVKRNLAEEKKIAKERILELFKQADKSDKLELSNRYIELARKMAMKYKVRIPSDLQKKFCKHCYKYLNQGVNCRVRTRDGKVIYSCLECGNFMRFPFVKERKESRK